MKSKKKILIIVAIVLVIIIALAGTALGMVLTGKISITSKQKLARGLSDLTSKISISELEENFKEYEKMQTTPFEMKNVITANINKIELEDANGMEELLAEIKNVAQDTIITNTLQADFRNNIIKNDLKINLADVIEEISLDMEYNNDTLSLRSKELNEKYLTITKKETLFNDEYGDLLEVFELFENICKKETTSINLTDAEKAHFTENYKDIFSNYMADVTIKEEKTTISVDGENIECTDINFTLDKNQIVELAGKYLSKLEQDTEGKKIIVNRVQSMVNSFEEQDLIELINDLKYELSYIDDDISLKVSIYCTMFKTYGMNIKIVDGTNDTVEMNMIIGKLSNVITITFPIGDISIKKENNITEMTLEIYVEEYDTEFRISVTNEIVAKTENSHTSKGTIGLLLKEGENNIDITLIMDTNLRYLSSVDTAVQSSNSLNLITDSQEELQAYFNEYDNNLTAIQSTTQNSKLAQIIYSALYSESSELVGTVQSTPKEFNNMFQDYTGNPSGSKIKTLLQTLATSNEKNTLHKISVSIVENEVTILNPTTDSQEISASILNVNPNNEYTILVTSLDDEGYITGIQIKKI